MTAEFAVGDSVLCHGVEGTIKFVGETEFSPGVWVGVELTKARGKHDGQVDGVRYFDTKDNYGVFVPADSPALEMFDPKTAAIIKVQSLARQKQALTRSNSMDMDVDLETFRGWDSLDRMHEQDALLNTALSSQVHQILKNNGAKPHNEKTNRKQLRALKSTIQLELPSGREDYTREFCLTLVKRAKKLKAGEALVAPDMVQQILYHFTLLMDEGAECMQRLNAPPVGTLAVVGDTHGQLKDLLWIFFKHGLPSSEMVYLFNGDLTDRGDSAVDIWVILLSFKLYDPSIVCFNRGNHEDDSMNNSYGFLDELTQKYGDRGFDLYRNFQYIFCTLPLYTVVNDKIFVVHAGLPRQSKYIKLSNLANLDFKRPIPDRPRNGEDTLFFDSVWSDPCSGEGTEPNTRGPDVVSFGPDLTRKFLENNDLTMVIRSHQVPSTLKGYQWHHSDTVLTVFSASNYCGVSGNQGAVALITKETTLPTEVVIVEHWAPDWESAIEHLLLLEKDTEKATQQVKMEAINIAEERQLTIARGKKRTNMEEEIVAQAKPLFVLHKKALFQFWRGLDPDKTFHISVKEWQDGCAAICDEKVPWKKLRGVLGLKQTDFVKDETKKESSKKDEPCVAYIPFLNRFRIAFSPAPNMPEIILGWEERTCEDLYRALLKADLSVDATFAAIDRNRDGTVGWDELQTLLENCCTYSVTPQQSQDILVSLGASATQRVNLLQFLDKLRLAFRRSNLPPVKEENKWIPTALDKLSLVMLKDAQSRFVADEKSATNLNTLLITRWFEEADANSNGYLCFQELYDAIKKLPEKEIEQVFAPAAGGLCEANVQALMDYCDIDKSTYLSYLEFVQFLSVIEEDKNESEFQESELDTICNSVYFHSLAIKQAVRYFNPKGMVTPEEFAQALQAVSTAFFSTNGYELFTPKQAHVLASTPHADETNKINTLAFLQSFRLIDTQVACGA